MEITNKINQIGNTPLIKLKQVSELTGCNIYGKAEYFNPGESVKDRAALFIVEDALIDLVRTLAQDFPNRRILIQVKSNFINTKPGQDFINACTLNLQNVFLETDPIYTLFNKARYGMKILNTLFKKVINNPKKYIKNKFFYNFSKERMVCDFIAGMTDRYAINLYNSIK